MSNLFRAIPAVDLCLEALTAADPGLAQAPRALMRVHTSNYRIVGFHSAVSLPELAALAREARALAARLRKHLGPACRVSLRPDVSHVGGGAFPQCDLPTTLVCLKPAAMSATALKTALLDADPPLIGRLEEENFCLDPRTLERPDWNAALRVLQRALRAAQPIITDKETR